MSLPPAEIPVWVHSSAKNLLQYTVMKASHTLLTVPSSTSATILVRHSKSPEDREIGRGFALLWEVLAPTLQEIFTECDDKSNLVVLALDLQAQDLSVYDFLMTCYVNWLMKQAIRLRIARPL